MGLAKGMENLEDFEKKYPDLYAAIFDRGREASVGGADDSTDNSTLEERAKAAWDKDPDLRFEFVDNFDIFLAFTRADKAGRAKTAGGISQDGKKDTQAPIDSTDENLPIEDRAKSAWDKDPDLRFEFVDNFDAYLAFAKADKAGQAKIVGGISRRAAK